MSKNIEQELRKEILSALKLTGHTNCPKLFRMIQTEEGYRWTEETIINMVANTGQAPLMCIPQLESELF